MMEKERGENPMPKHKLPVTQAIRVLKKSRIGYTLYPYRYEEKGGTEIAARELNVDEHQVIKTLVMENPRGDPVLVLMHGDRQVSTKALARALKVKTMTPCEEGVAHKHTGYFVGGISPFGTKKQLKVYVESTIMDLPFIYINAGRKGLLARISSEELVKVVKPTLVNVAI